MKNSKLNVDLIQSTFGSIKDPASLLGDCEKDLKDFLVAVISNCEILVGEKYVEEDDLYCCLFWSYWLLWLTPIDHDITVP